VRGGGTMRPCKSFETGKEKRNKEALKQSLQGTYLCVFRIYKSIQRRRSSMVRSVLGTASAHTTTNRMSGDLGKVVHVNEVKNA
jgi:hypothetical protein